MHNIAIPTTNDVEIPLESQQINVRITHQKHQSNQNDSDSNDRLNIIGWFVQNDEYRPLTSDEQPGLIRKVCSIMMCQLVLTTIMCIISYFSFDYRKFQLEYKFLYYIALALGLLIQMKILYRKKFACRVPYNYILLFLFIRCEGYMISFLCSSVYNGYGEDGCFVVIIVIIFTLATVVGLTIYTLISKDFKAKVAILCMVCIDLIIFGIMTGINYENVRNMIFSVIIQISIFQNTKLFFKDLQYCPLNQQFSC